MKTKPLTFLLALTFLFLFVGISEAHRSGCHLAGIPAPPTLVPIFVGILGIVLDVLTISFVKMENLSFDHRNLIVVMNLLNPI